MAENFLVEEEDFDEPRHQIRMEQLRIQEQLGDKIFYVFHRGELRNGDRRLEVVVKGPANRNDGIQKAMVSAEIRLLIEIQKHPNILGFVGVAMEEGPHVSSVFEFATKGGLRKFLRDSEAQGKFINQMVEEDNDGFEMVNMGNNQNNSNNERCVIKNDPDAIYISDLVGFGYQIANCMKFLAGLKYVHRQLALRGMYITTNNIIRVGDLGLARNNEQKQYYRIANPKNPLPFHTTAPEALTKHKFTQASDVWSFGCCLYEIFTFARTPLYENGLDVLKYLEEGNRLPKPDYCPEELYKFILKCWAWDPEERPTFEQCVDFLEQYLDRHAPQVLRKVRENLEAASEFQRTLEDWVR